MSSNLRKGGFSIEPAFFVPVVLVGHVSASVRGLKAFQSRTDVASRISRTVHIQKMFLIRTSSVITLSVN